MQQIFIVFSNCLYATYIAGTDKSKMNKINMVPVPPKELSVQLS